MLHTPSTHGWYSINGSLCLILLFSEIPFITSRRYEFTFILKSISIAERVDQSNLNFFSSKRFFPGHLYSPMSQ